MQAGAVGHPCMMKSIGAYCSKCLHVCRTVCCVGASDCNTVTQTQQRGIAMTKSMPRMATEELEKFREKNQKRAEA